MRRSQARTKLLAIISVLAMILGACGGGTDRADAVQELLDVGFAQGEAECVYDGVTEAIGDVSRLEDDDVSEEEIAAAADVFVQCSSALDEAVGEVAATSSDTPAAPATTALPAAADTAVETNDTAAVAASSSAPAIAGGPGHWSWDELCSLVTDAEVASLFTTANPVAGERGVDTATWSSCKWEDPDVAFDPAKATPKLFVVLNMDRDGSNPRLDLEQVALVGLTGNDGATFRDEFDPGMSALHVYLVDQTLQIDFPMGTGGGRELAETAAQRWVDAQLGGTSESAMAESATTGAATTTRPTPPAADPGGASGSGDAPGTDAVLDSLWVACAAGDPDGCDRLYLAAPIGSNYEEFGSTCGDRAFTDCTVLLGDDNGSYTPTTPAPGDDPTLDGYWVACGGGDPAACSLLYFDSEIGSDYEYYGETCGGRGLYSECEVAMTGYTG